MAAYTLEQLQGLGLPVVRVWTETVLGIEFTQADFSRPLTAGENQTFLSVADPLQANKLQAIIDGANLGNWWTWTQAQFTAWCDANLMTDTAIDGTTLSAPLKTNIKAINAFVRNAGKLLIVARDVIKWIVSKQNTSQSS